MVRKRHTAEQIIYKLQQIIYKLREAEVDLAKGVTIGLVSKKLCHL